MNIKLFYKKLAKEANYESHYSQEKSHKSMRQLLSILIISKTKYDQILSSKI